ncbi:MAG TPA: peptidase S51 [Vicinamibacteria bacterium]|nr:peptidase S51 [Vicinamibacteria bacterium]
MRQLGRRAPLRALASGGLLLAVFASAAGSAEAKVTRYRSGNPADVRPTLFGPVHDLGGGGTDVDAALQCMIDEVRGCSDCATTVDVVILRASGADGYNASILAMNGVDSVESLVITSSRDSNRAEVRATVENAEVVFFAGGDQCDYVRNFKGTLVEAAVESVYARGGGVGGTSAGLAILGEIAFDACHDTVTSAEALANPYDRRLSFTYDLFRFRDLVGTLTDTHFVRRDRLGRLLTFLARQIQDGRAGRVLGVAVNDETSLVVDSHGLGRVLGAGPVYFILADHLPEVCRPQTPLTYTGFKVWKVPAGRSFDLRVRPETGFTLLSVTGGAVGPNPY